MTQLSTTENILSETWLWLGIYQKSWSQDVMMQLSTPQIMISSENKAKNFIMGHSWELMKSWFSQ